MNDKRVFILAHAQARNGAMHCVAHAPDGWVVEIKPKTRSLEQNARMWAMLTEISRQVEWYGKKLTPDAWKCVFSASLKKQEVTPGLHGDFVVIGQSTSQMTIREMTDLIDLMSAFGAERGVRFEEEVPGVKVNPEFLEALDHFATPRLDGGNPAEYVYVTQDKDGRQTPWSFHRVCGCAFELLDTEELSYLKLGVLKAGLKRYGAEGLYERIMGEPLK